MKTEEFITRRISYLEQLIATKRASLEAAPEGALRVSKHRDSWQYYYRETPSQKNGKYIRRSEEYFAQSLAQRDYDVAVIEKAERELEKLQEYAKAYRVERPENIYSTLQPTLQSLIKPIRISDKQYIEEWLSTPYEKKPFNDGEPEYYSDEGIRVRSKSEIIIANELTKLGIPFLYEKPLVLSGYGVVHPDFTIPDLVLRSDVYFEHFGIMDDRYYCEKALNKINLYERNGYFLGDRFIATFETYRSPLNTSTLHRKLINTFKNKGYPLQ